MSRKADACWIIPLTADEHDELHRIGAESFERRYGMKIRLTEWARMIEIKWKNHLAAHLHQQTGAGTNDA